MLTYADRLKSMRETKNPSHARKKEAKTVIPTSTISALYRLPKGMR
ncbi:MAG: hypothetical protein L6V93_11360 [Clostridiales bacterium]|nr:MAG: hypothetical protein L6V93_11360 [Clostridiales bacterium]